MGTIPTPPTFTAGEKPTATKLNQIATAINFWAASPRVFVYQGTATTSTTSSSYSVVGFDSEVFDVVQSGDSPMHDTVTTNSRLYCRTAGKYRFGAQVGFAFNATGAREMQVRLNAAGNVASGTQLYYGNAQALTGSGFPTAVQGEPFEHAMLVGDYIEVFVQQNSGGSLSTVVGMHQTFAWMELIGS